MALITCPECGESISDKAASCPRCGFPSQPQSTIEKHCDQPKSKRKPKKAIKVLLIILAIVVTVAIAVGSFLAYIKRPKDEAYLYEWMTENASLIDGTRLQYTDTQKNGSKFTLNYDTYNYVESMKWYIEYDIPEREGYCTTVHVTLYWEDNECPATITVSGTGNLDGYNRTLKYSHNPESFTRGSPIKTNSYSGSTVPTDGNFPELAGSSFLDSERLLQAKLEYMDQKCSILAHSSLCKVLDWLNESFCPEANMSISDFGYSSYK
jgi:hypothetical protein